MSVIDAPAVVDPLETIPVLPEEPKEKELSPAKQLIKRALEVWDQKGYYRGLMEGSNGAVCAIGALDYAAFGRVMHGSQTRVDNRAYADAVRLLVGSPNHSGYQTCLSIQAIMSINDQEGYNSIRRIFERALDREE